MTEQDVLDWESRHGQIPENAFAAIRSLDNYNADGNKHYPSLAMQRICFDSPHMEVWGDFIMFQNALGSVVMSRVYVFLSIILSDFRQKFAGGTARIFNEKVDKICRTGVCRHLWRHCLKQAAGFQSCSNVCNQIFCCFQADAEPEKAFPKNFRVMGQFITIFVIVNN